MMKKSERTLEKYALLGAKMRILKTLMAEVITETNDFLTVAEQGRIERAYNSVCRTANILEEKLFSDYKNKNMLCGGLEYNSYFYGSTHLYRHTETDNMIHELMAEVVNQLLQDRAD